MNGAKVGEAPKRIVEETRRLYADLLSRPLDEKQLARPSFKFIQEIVKKLITETRTLRNVFNPSDFDTETKSWDKRMRTDFIQRLIDFTANNKEPVVGCVAAKLVAGLEPVKCNELLQALAKIAQSRLTGQHGKGPRTFTRTMQPVPPTSRSGRVQPDGVSRGQQKQQQQQQQLQQQLSSQMNSGAASSRRASDRSQLGLSNNNSSTSSSRQSSLVTRRGSSKENVRLVAGTSGPPSRRTSGGSADSKRQVAAVGSSPPETISSPLQTRSRQQTSGNSSSSSYSINRVVSKQPTNQLDSLKDTTTAAAAATAATLSKEVPSSASSTRRDPMTGNGVLSVSPSRIAVDVTSESDMSRGIQLLRVNMRQFKTLLGDIGQLEAGLKSKLIKYQ